MGLKAFNAHGQEISSGDEIKDFRGDTAKFVRCTRERGDGRSGLVVVKWAELASSREYYDKVFGLTVTNVPD